MTIIHEPELFSWKDIDSLIDLERLKLVIVGDCSQGGCFLKKTKK